MNSHILWTPIALQSLSEVFDYTYEEFGESQLQRLHNQIDIATQHLSAFPLAGKKEDHLSEETGIEYRSIVVIKEIKLIYTIHHDTLFIEYVRNVRLDDATILSQLNK